MFHYDSISTSLIDSLASGLESDLPGLAIVGPRFSGKRYVLNRVAERLRQREKTVFLTSLDDFAGQEDKPWLPFLENLQPGPSNRAQAVLLVGDIDNLNQKKWLTFISNVRQLVDANRLQVVLTGGAVLVEWLQASKELSDFDGYVLQGFDLAEFKQLASVWAQQESIVFSEPERQLQMLWQWTSGSNSLLGWFYYLVIEQRLAQSAPFQPLDDDKLHELFQRLIRRGVRWAPSFPRATYEIRREPAIWDALEKLLRTGRVTAVDAQGVPTALELSGIGKRQGSEINFASEVMRDFAHSYYDSRRLGDFWASQGDWTKAFARFSLGTLPPYYFERTEAKQTVASLCELLQYDSGNGVQKVHDRFVDISRDYFGCQLWRLTWNGECWELTAQHYRNDHEFDPAWLDRLPQGSQLTAGKYLALFEDPARGACLLLGDPRPGWLNAYVVIDDMDDGLTGIRRRLFNRILTSFASAYQSAIELEAAKIRQQDSEIQKEALAELFRMIGRGSTTRDLCEIAAQRLRLCGYRRVLISLVDPERTKIRGVFDSSPDSSINVAAETDYPLSDPRADVQPYVIVTNTPVIAADALKAPLVNPNVARRAGMRSIAILPIPSLFNPTEAIGTIHVERADRAYPTEVEITDLRTFAVGFSGALCLAEQSLYWTNLGDVFGDPVFFARADRDVILNKAASILTDESNNSIPPAVADGLARARERRNLCFTSLGNNEPFPAVILSDKLTDNLGNTLGRFSVVRRFDRTNRFLQVYTHIAAAHDFHAAIDVLFKEFQRLGFDSGRLYLLPKDSPESLVLVDCFYEDPEQRNRVLNQRERMSWPKRSDPEPNLPWRAINSGEPVIFQYLPDEPHGLTWSPEGFPVTKDPNPFFSQILGKEPGCYWIELPLLGTHGPLGKVVLQGELPAPEDFELYRLLVASSTELLTAFMEYEYRSQLVSREQAEQLMSETLHNINGRLGLFRSAVGEYRFLEGANPDTQEVTERIERALEGVARMTQAAARGVARIVLIPKPLNVRALVDSISLTRNDCVIDVIGPAASAEMEGDSAHMEAMFNELLNNSVEAYFESRRGCPAIRVEIDRFVHARSGHHWLQIRYSDDGPGISDERKAVIFEPWRSYHANSTDGRGLGLSYVRRVVEAHGGSIRAENKREEEGALFVIRLPIKQISTGIGYPLYDWL